MEAKSLTRSKVQSLEWTICFSRLRRVKSPAVGVASMKNSTVKPQTSGFTLTELLVVIGIISLLVAVLMPSLGLARRSARRSSCRSQLHGVAVALRMYLDDNRDLMPVAAQVPSTEPNLPSMTEALLPYLKNREAMHCPADRVDSYYAKEGTSYEYPFVLRGQRVNQSFLGKRWGAAQTPVLFDFGPFHNRPGRDNAINFLFGDGHVGQM